MRGPVGSAAPSRTQWSRAELRTRFAGTSPTLGLIALQVMLFAVSGLLFHPVAAGGAAAVEVARPQALPMWGARTPHVGSAQSLPAREPRATSMVHVQIDEASFTPPPHGTAVVSRVAPASLKVGPPPHQKATRAVNASPHKPSRRSRWVTDLVSATAGVHGHVVTTLGPPLRPGQVQTLRPTPPRQGQVQALRPTSSPASGLQRGRGRTAPVPEATRRKGSHETTSHRGQGARHRRGPHGQVPGPAGGRTAGRSPAGMRGFQPA